MAKVVRKIYGQLVSIRARKTGTHRCDAECRRLEHLYQHDFKPGAKVYGLSNGDILITRRTIKTE